MRSKSFRSFFTLEFSKKNGNNDEEQLENSPPEFTSHRKISLTMIRLVFRASVTLPKLKVAPRSSTEKRVGNRDF